MTTRRRVLVFGLLAGLLALSGGVWLLWPRPGITRANAAKIKVGMTLPEVEAILGGPARCEATGEVVVEGEAVVERNAYPRLAFRDARTWQSNTVEIWVTFDADERVADIDPIPLRHESALELVRRWLRL